jgi:hypothetical protein
MRSLTSILLFLLLNSMATLSYAQDCDWYPADCPHESSIESSKDSNANLANHVLSAEMAMMDRVRNFFSENFARIAASQHWQLVEFNENSTVAACAKTGGIPYPLRAPFIYNISFLLMVQPDTLGAWKKWADEFKEKILQQSNENVQSLQNNASPNEAVTKKYLDSAAYYGSKKTAYMQQHGQQYASDIQNGNQKGIKEFESTTAKFDKTVTGFTDKAYSSTSKGLSRMEQQTSQNQLEEKVKTQHYRDAATLLIHITINDPVQGTGISDPETQKYILPQKKWLLPGAAFGGLLHNSLPLGTDRLRSDGDYDMDYVHPTDIGNIFFGAWLPVETQYNTYHAAFTASKINTDCVSPKKNSCDKIQVMTLYIEGKENNITRFVQLLDTQKISALISR